MPKNEDFALTQLSPAARHALSAASHLARQAPGRMLSVKDIGKECGLPSSFLAKILKRLARRGIVVSRRGPGGGHRLARPAGDITLAEVVTAARIAAPVRRRCLLELRGCGDGAPCAIHDLFEDSERRLWKALRAVTLRRYAAGGEP